MPLTNFCCRSGGSNLNAGTRTGNTTVPGVAADLTYASGTWVQATRVFTVASGDPVADGVAVGDYVSVYADGDTVTGYVAQVTARTTTTITTSATVRAGTAPTDGTLTRTLKVGGAWLGPNGSSGFPFSMGAGALGALKTNAAANRVCINLMNDATYSITAVITNSHDINNGLVIAGFSSAYRDTGRAIIDGGTSGASYSLFTFSGKTLYENMIFQNNGATGSAAGVNGSGFAQYQVKNCIVHDVRGAGFDCTNATAIFVECEAYLCNTSNTANRGGWLINGTTSLINCISHDNAGANNDGFYIAGGSVRFVNCIADTNGRYGFWQVNNSNNSVFQHCDAYNNGGDGFRMSASGNGAFVKLVNCNAVSNLGYGLNVLTCGTTWIWTIDVHNFGTFNNSSGASIIDSTWVETVSGGVAYASVPWVDPANGDFQINLAAAKGAGRGEFTQTQAGYGGTAGYPDIGAAQHQETGGGGVQVARGMHGGMQ